MTEEQVRSIAEKNAKDQLSNSEMVYPMRDDDFIDQLFDCQMVGTYRELYRRAVSLHLSQCRINGVDEPTGWGGRGI